MTIEELKKGADHFNIFIKSLLHSLEDFDELACDFVAAAKENNKNPTQENKDNICKIVAQMNNNIQLANGLMRIINHQGESINTRIDSLGAIIEELEGKGIRFEQELYNPDNPT